MASAGMLRSHITTLSGGHQNPLNFLTPMAHSPQVAVEEEEEEEAKASMGTVAVTRDRAMEDT